jgi:hypothetical protein
MQWNNIYYANHDEVGGMSMVDTLLEVKEEIFIVMFASDNMSSLLNYSSFLLKGLNILSL